MSADTSTPSWETTAAWIIALFIAAIFALAAAPKIAQPAAFAEAVFRYHLLPDSAINLFAVYMPWTEAVLALALIAGARYRKGALLLAIALLVVFIIAMSINLYRGVDIACGCFSVASTAESMSWLNIARNIGLIALALLAWRWTPARNAA
ncbi:MAG: DoxX family protein [Kiritimatiellae bacterium]|nr:DoxX family protein [Kiritimatiellia bacterium]MCO5067126.1 DoxX family protein [Kiritimatiellia bacterium]